MASESVDVSSLGIGIHLLHLFHLLVSAPEAHGEGERGKHLRVNHLEGGLFCGVRFFF